MKHIIKNWLLILFTLSLIAIVSALIAEFYFDLYPCKMCLKQRHPYYVIIALMIIFYFFKNFKILWISVVTQLAIIYGLFYSLWHVGVEQKILPNPVSCSGLLSKTNSIENLKEQINNQSVISCSEISWTILGLSAATINSALLLFILIFNSIYILKKYND